MRLSTLFTSMFRPFRPHRRSNGQRLALPVIAEIESFETRVLMAADLLVSGSVSASPNTVPAGGTLTVNYTMHNSGSSAAAASQTKIQVKLQGSNVQAYSEVFSVPALPSGKASSQSHRLTLPATLPAGTYVAFAILDNFNMAGQGPNTGNDYSQASNSFRVTAAAIASTPNPPSNLSVGSVSASQVNLRWQDNSNDEIGFRIERKTGTTGSWSQIASVGANVTSYRSTGLSAETSYSYRVRSSNAATATGNSNYSNEVNATTTVAPKPPNPPSNLTASVTPTGKVNLAWNDNSNNETGFRIERKQGTAGSWLQVKVVGANVLNYQSAALSPDTNYSFRVRAINSVKNSDPSNEVGFTTPTVLSMARASLRDLKQYPAMANIFAQLSAPIQNDKNHRSAVNYQNVIDQFEVDAAVPGRDRYSTNASGTKCNIFAGDVMRAMGAALPLASAFGRTGVGQMTGNAGFLNEWFNGRRNTSSGLSATNAGWRRIDTSSQADLDYLLEQIQTGHPAVLSSSNHIAVIRPDQNDVQLTRDQILNLRIAQAGDDVFNRGTISRIYRPQVIDNGSVQFFVHT